ncbi:MAG: TonB-dependent receptor [Alphaproteobacteria bacterium]|nr:TonB-dependent receptor [Alphaproteobacteria bacterium]
MKSKPFFALFGASAMALMAAPAYAQSADSDEIIVTARQRSEALQDVPGQVTVFNAAAIEARGIERPADFIAQVPNVTFVEAQNAGTSFLVIRGITQARNSEPSAAIVVDGVPMTQPAQFNSELTDIAQIEVVKGPQGALYGRNAIGGAILITTKKPTDTYEGRVMVGYESGPGWETQGVIGGPIAEGLGFRAAVSYFDTEGHLENANTTDASAERDVDPVEAFNVRLSFLYEPTPNFSADLRLSTDFMDTRALYYVIPDFFAGGVPNPNFNDPNFTDQPINLNNSGKNEREIYDAALKLTWDFDAGTFTSITGFNSVQEILTGDGYAFDPFGQSRLAPPFDFNQSQFLDVQTFTQEFRFTSPESSRIRWIAGAQLFSTDRYISTGNMCDVADDGVIPLYREPFPVYCFAPGGFVPHAQISFLADSQEQFAWAGYVATSTNLTEDLELSVNLRYDRDRRENTTETPQFYLTAGGIAGTQGQVREETWDDWQPQVILRYAANDDLNLFGSYSRGFRSGGFNQTGVSTAAAASGLFGVGDLFDQETADTFELGFKSTLWDGRVLFNGSAYHTTSQGSYYFIFIASNSTQNLGNIDEIELQGLDLELNARLTDNLMFNAGLGITDSEITEFADPLAVGAKAPLVSDYTFNAGFQYTLPLNDSGLEGFLRVDYNRIGETVFTVPFRNPASANNFLEAEPKERDPVDLVDARIGVQNEAWSLVAWSKNLFDEEYNSEYSPGGFLFKAQPARWGIQLTRRF